MDQVTISDLLNLGTKQEQGINVVNHLVTFLREKIESSSLKEGSCKSIRKVMEAMELEDGEWLGLEKKQLVLAALKTVSLHAPEEWVSTLAVAPDLINDLAKAAKGFTKINGNTTLNEVKLKIDTLLETSNIEKMDLCCCFPKKK